MDTMEKIVRHVEQGKHQNEWEVIHKLLAKQEIDVKAFGVDTEYVNYWISRICSGKNEESNRILVAEELLRAEREEEWRNSGRSRL